MIPAALLCVNVYGCADQQVTDPRLPHVARTYDVPFNKFFVAWSQSYSSSPIETQMFALDERQERQYAGVYPYQSVLSFARAHPGRLYINGDEVDQSCLAAEDYAVLYHDFVAAVRDVDPTARFSPSGFAEPNYYCCPPPGVEPCVSFMHSTGYAEQFYNAYVRLYGVTPPVDEWRFHDMGLSFPVGDLDGWWARVDNEASWSVAHGANMVLGGWGFFNWFEPVPALQEHLKQAIGRLMNDKRIIGSVYWSHEQWGSWYTHYLMNTDGSLTPEGQTFVNPLTDVPTGVKIIGSADGHAKLRWSNTTSAWATEAEFWVRAPGSNSFVYRSTELVAAPGSTQTPIVAFNVGDAVKGRVRYYNVYGQAAWSSFSNNVLLALTQPDPDQRGPGKSPLFCFLKLC